MNPKCVECGCCLDSEDMELNDDLCDACRQGIIYQEVYPDDNHFQRQLEYGDLEWPKYEDDE